MPDDLAVLRRNPVPQPNNLVISSKTLEIEAAFPHVQPLLRALPQLGSAVIWAQRRDHPQLEDHGIILIRFSGQIESQFGLTREVALVVAPYEDLRYQTFRALPSILGSVKRDVTERIVLISSRDPREGTKLDDWSNPDRHAIGVGTVSGPPRSAAMDLARILRSRIYSRNPYAATAPVQDDAFFGRRLVVQELLDAVEQQRPISLVGLRKSGKTSLLKETAAHLSRGGDSITILRDLESLPQLPERVIPDLIKDIVQDLIAALKDRNEGSAALEGLPTNPSVSDWRRAAKADFGRLRHTRRVLVALDEIEYVCPPALLDNSNPNCAEVTQFLGALRSLAQETSNFAFMVAGLTPDIFRRGMLYGRHNPLFSWVSVHHVRPFSQAEALEMLDTLGRRMGLTWSRNAVGMAVARAGGHAFMLRTLGATVAGKFKAEDEDRTVSDSLVRSSVAEWHEQIQPNIDEAVSHVERYYVMESKLLGHLRDKNEEGVPASERLLASPALKNLVALGLAEYVPQRAGPPKKVKAVDFLLTRTS